MALDVGKMRYEVRIEKPSTAPDPAGEPIGSWVLVVDKRRAELMATPGREFYSAAERQARVPTMFKIRHPRSDFTVEPQMRLVFKGRWFDILSAVDPDGLEVELVISTEERVGEPL
jgi:SPP1 family predicted phage head-tail adaptor